MSTSEEGSFRLGIDWYLVLHLPSVPLSSSSARVVHALIKVALSPSLGQIAGYLPATPSLGQIASFPPLDTWVPPS